jgi:hypothetical protein
LLFNALRLARFLNTSPPGLARFLIGALPGLAWRLLTPQKNNSKKIEIILALLPICGILKT